jgi:hypothetical protein
MATGASASSKRAESESDSSSIFNRDAIRLFASLSASTPLDVRSQRLRGGYKRRIVAGFTPGGDYAGTFKAQSDLGPFARRSALPKTLRGKAAVKRCWEIIADNLSKAGWGWGCVATVDSIGRTIWIVDAPCDNGRMFVVRSDAQFHIRAFLKNPGSLSLLDGGPRWSLGHSTD